MKKKKVPPRASFNKALIADLKNDPALAEELLRVAFEEAGTEEGDYLLQKTLQLVTAARGVGKIAKSAGIPRESLSRALSPRGNPRLSTLQAITGALGLHLTVARI
jgi:probable addiction module antidote protein